MATFAFGTVLDNFKTQLDARGNLSGVQIDTGPVNLDVRHGREHIYFGTVTQTDEQLAMGPANRLEGFTIEGIVWVAKPGDQNAMIKAARDRAIALLKEIKDQLTDDQTVNGACLRAEFGSYEATPLAGDSLRIQQIEFTIECVAVNP